MSTAAYREDIDGLRAIAVLAVVLFHARYFGKFDGFVGVDIFFVISGYLISGIVSRSIRAGTFTMKDFLVRRIKRIVPVLYVVVSVTAITGVFLMLPADLKALGKATFSSVGAASNVYFWYSEDTDYFARSSDLLPLLHTWSLGVEEQFYLFWPLVLLVAYRAFGSGTLFWVTTAVAAASFVAAESLLTVDPAFSYYMLPARAGELLVGGLCFLLTDMRKDSGRAGAWYEVAAISGALLIGYALFFAHASGSFPGLSALYPCLGAALIIYSGQFRKTAVARVLSTRALVFVGVISYSLYLWHWPVLAYAKYLFVAPSLGLTLGCLAVVLALSTLSYHFVEVPLRAAKIAPRHVFGLYLIAPAAVLALLGLLLYGSNGFEAAIAGTTHYREIAGQRDRYTSPATQYDYVCQTNDFRPEIFTEARCLVGTKTAPTTAFLWGDSHAAHYVGFVGAIAESGGFSVRNAELGSCPPVFRPDVQYGGTRNRAECARFRARVAAELEAYDVVYIGGMWSSYFDEPGFRADFAATVDALLAARKKVVVLGQPPIFEAYDRNCALRNERLFKVDCRALGTRPATTSSYNDFLKTLASGKPGVEFLSAESNICDHATCSAYRNGAPIYFDSSHMSIYGSWELGRAFVERLRASSGSSGDLTQRTELRAE